MRKIINKKIIWFVLVIMGLSITAYAQDAMLSLIKNKSDFVLHVLIIDIQGGGSDESGVENWWAKYKIIQPIKGNMRKDWEGTFYFNRFNYKNKKEIIPIEKNKEYVVFLKGKVGKFRFPNDESPTIAHTLVDRWVGILPYNEYLVERLVKYIEEK
ncbi:MAG: hypothetical protein ABII27_05825 [bacterium]